MLARDDSPCDQPEHIVIAFILSQSGYKQAITTLQALVCDTGFNTSETIPL